MPSSISPTSISCFVCVRHAPGYGGSGVYIRVGASMIGTVTVTVVTVVDLSSSGNYGSARHRSVYGLCDFVSAGPVFRDNHCLCVPLHAMSAL
jgi:hypothetical protein